MKINFTRLLCLCVLLSASALSGNACINAIGRSTVSEPIYVEELGPGEFLKALTTHEGKAHWLGVLAELQVPGARWSFPAEKQTNTAVAMLHLGMVKQAIRILKEIERTNPGLYYTAANLGTAYELNGENAKALEWIKEGINRNADAHNGSEWLHVKILEAKLAIEKDPDLLSSHSVLGLNQTPNEHISPDLRVTDHLGQTHSIDQIKSALIYQLHERLEFIKPPEDVVANLLFDLSRILALTNTAEHSAVIRGFALAYGSDRMPWEVTPIYQGNIVVEESPILKYAMALSLAVSVLIVAGIIILMRKFL